jgi:hypothetical protein
MKKCFVIHLSFFSLCFNCLAVMHKWTSKAGTHLVAEMTGVDVTERTVTLKKTDGTLLNIPIDTLSDEDIAFASMEWPKIQSSMIAAQIERARRAMFATYKKCERSNQASTSGENFDASSCVVLVTDPKGGGTGFLAKQDGHIFFYTAVHLLASLSSPKFLFVSGDELEIAADTTVQVSLSIDSSDVCRIMLEDDSLAAYEIDDVIKLGEDVNALGNSLNEKVITSVAGKISGIGTGEIETSCPVVPGNSGGPIVSVKSGKVVGLVTRAAKSDDDAWNKGTPFAGVRRFAARLGRVNQWVTTSFTELQKQYCYLEQISAGSKALEALLSFRFGLNGLFAPNSPEEKAAALDALESSSYSNVGSAVNHEIKAFNKAMDEAWRDHKTALIIQNLPPEFKKSVFGPIAKMQRLNIKPPLPDPVPPMPSSVTLPLIKAFFEPIFKVCSADFVDVEKFVSLPFLSQRLEKERAHRDELTATLAKLYKALKMN